MNMIKGLDLLGIQDGPVQILHGRHFDQILSDFDFVDRPTGYFSKVGNHR